MGMLLGTETRSLPLSFPIPPVPAYVGASLGGGDQERRLRADPNRALVVPTVWACVALLANTVSTMPLQTFRRDGDGTPVRVEDPPVVAQPAAGLSQSEWLHIVMVSLLLRGNTLGLIASRDARLRPAQLELLSFDQVRITTNRDSGRLEYRLGVDDRDRAEDIWHVRGLTLPGTKIGLSPVAYGAAAMGVDLSARAFGSGFFEDGAHPSAVLTADKPIDQPAAETIKARFRAAIRGREPAVLGAGVKYTPIQVAPNESQFLETLQANVPQIARFFGVPAEMVGGSSGDSLTYANVEQRSLDFLTYAVSHWLRRIEEAVTAILEPGLYVRFDVTALLRTDAKTQAEIDQLQIASHVRAPSEVRHAHDWPKLTTEQAAELAALGPVKTPAPSTAQRSEARDRAGDLPAGEVRVVVPVEIPVAVEVPVTVPESRTDVTVNLPETPAAPPPTVHVDVAAPQVTVPVMPPDVHLNGPTSTTVQHGPDGEITGTTYHYDGE